MDDLEPGDPERVGRYRLAGRIGAGGMGVVYLAHSDDGVAVALKVIRPELACEPTFRQRFGREVRAAQRVRSPVTVAVLDADPEAQLPWVAFEYVEGPNLEQVVAARPPRLSAAVGIVSGIAEALVAIHDAGIVHRDLKPSNVLCPPDGVKVIDFGIASALEGSALTGTGALIGTPAWLAPEQVNGDVVTPAVDVFAWGCVAVYVLTGHLAFGQGDEGPAALMYRIAHLEPDLAGVPPSLVGLVSAALAKRPGDRPDAARLLRQLLPGAPTAPSNETVRQVAHAGVEVAAAGAGSTEPIPAPPPEGGRRRAGLAIAAVAVVVVAATVAAVALSRPGNRQPPVTTPTTAATVSTTAPATTATTVSLASLGQQYLAIVAPANQAIFMFTTQAATLPRTATGADLVRLSAPAVAATSTAIQALLRVAWPEPVRTDVRGLVAADAQLVTDLQNSDLVSYSEATNRIEQDTGKTKLAGSTVRADLGLPPPNTSP